MIKLFTPPIFEDGEKARKAVLFFKLYLGMLFIILTSEIVNIIILPENYIRWVLLSASTTFFYLIVLWLNRKGHTRFAAYLFLILNILVIFCLAWTAGGIKAAVILYLPVIVLVAGLILGWRVGISIGFVLIICGLGLVVADSYGLLPVSKVVNYPLSLWFNSAFSIAFLALLQYISIANLENSYKQTKQELSTRKEIEKELRKSEAFRKQIFESSRVPIVVMDALTNRYIDCNQAAIHIYRSNSKEDTIGKSPIDFSPSTQYDGVPSAEKAKYYTNKALSEGLVVFEWKHQRPDGEFWDAEVHLMSFEADNRRLLQFSLFDITERKQIADKLKKSEDKFSVAFQSNPTPLTITRVADNQMIDVNHAFEKLSGYTVDEIIGHTAIELNTWVNPADRENVVHVLRKDGNIRDMELNFRSKSGSISACRISIELVEINDVRCMLTTIIDLTESKQAEQKIRESENRFRLILENMPILLNAFDEQGNIIVWNKACEEVTGYSTSEIIGNSKAMELLYPSPEYLEKVWNTSTDPQNKINTFDLLAKNGEIRTVEWFDIYHNLTIPGWASWGMGLDVTKRKQAEEALVESEKRYRSLFEGIPIGIYRTTPSGQIRDFNPAAIKMLAYDDMEVLLNQKITNFYINPEDRKKMMSVLDIDGSYNFEVEFRRNDHKIIWVHNSGRAVKNEQGQVVYFEGSLEDITERKLAQEALYESEERFRNLSNLLPQTIFETDIYGKITYVNQIAFSLFGYTPEDSVQGLSIFEMLDPVDRENAKKILIEVLSENITFRGENLALRKDGSTFPVIINTNSIVHNNKPVGIRGLIFDITELKQAEDKLKVSESRYRFISENTADVIWTLDLISNKFTFVSPSVEKLRGFTPEEVLNQTMDEALTKESIEKANQLFLEGISRRKKGDTTNFRTISLMDQPCKNGSVVSTEVASSLIFDDQGRPMQVIGVSRDITERKLAEKKLKESEERYRNLFEGANDAIFIIKDGRIFECNRMSVLLFGIPKTELITMSPADISPPIQSDGKLSSDKAVEKLSHCLEGKPQRFEWQHIHTNQSVFDADISLNRLEISGEMFVLAIVRDISERKRLQKEVYISTFKGEENERTRIAKDIHDGLGPLLSACKIYLHTLNSSKYNKDEVNSYHKLGELIDESMSSIKEISNNLSPHILRNFGLVHAVKNFISKIKTDVDFQVTCDSESNKRYDEVIEVTLYRVLTELINNTLKYAKASHITILMEEITNTYRVKYLDDGIGFNVNKTLKMAKGFGLVNMQSRIFSIGGKYDYKSKKNEGVEVNITINL